MKFFDFGFCMEIYAFVANKIEIYRVFPTDYWVQINNSENAFVRKRWKKF